MDEQRLINPNQFKRYFYEKTNGQKKKVKQMTFTLKASDFTGDMWITDLQLQMGNQATLPVINTSEFLQTKKYNIDEHVLYTGFSNTPITNGRKSGNAQPTAYSNVKNRMFNIIGRGHEVIALPNVFNEDYTQELLTSGLELTLKAKDDFDLLRISTNDGAWVPGRTYDDAVYDQVYKPNHHPLNYKYTREFYFNGGKAGDEIVLSCDLNKASVGDTDYPAGGRFTQMAYTRQSLPVAPFGSFRLRVEFYKMSSDLLKDPVDDTKKSYANYKDTGIGFYGYAMFTHTQTAQGLNGAHTF